MSDHYTSQTEVLQWIWYQWKVLADTNKYKSGSALIGPPPSSLLLLALRVTLCLNIVLRPELFWFVFVVFQLVNKQKNPGKVVLFYHIINCKAVMFIISWGSNWNYYIKIASTCLTKTKKKKN